MAIKTREFLKSLWVRGYKPLQVDYADLFDTMLIQTDPITAVGNVAVSAHLSSYDHTKITHSNRLALDSVSGINSGDQYIVLTGAISGQGGTPAISGLSASGGNTTYIQTVLAPGSIDTNSLSANSGIFLGRRIGIGSGPIESLPVSSAESFYNFVPNSRTINNYPLTANLNLKLDDLQNVAVSGVISGNLLKYNGTKWVPSSSNDTLPSQVGASGQFLTTNGISAYWDTVDALPNQNESETGKYLRTNGTDAFWDTVLPSQTNNANKFLTTDGNAAYWKTFGNINGYSLSATNITLTYASVSAEKYITKSTVAPLFPLNNELWIDIGDTTSYVAEHPMNAHTDYNIFYNNLNEKFKFNTSLVPREANLTGSLDEPSYVVAMSPSAGYPQWGELIYNLGVLQKGIWLIPTYKTANYINGNPLSISLIWYTDAVTGNAKFQYEFRSVTNGTLLTDSFNPSLTYTVISPANSTQSALTKVQTNLYPLSNDLMNGDMWFVGISRLGDDIEDTITNDIKIVEVQISEVLI